MLECAYPTLFMDASAKYKATGGGSRANPDISSDALEKLLKQMCGLENTVYEEALAVFDLRYRRMKKNKGACCRRI